MTKTPQEHRARHVELHKMFDELAADFIAQTGKMPSYSSIMELMKWSYEQTVAPTDLPISFKSVTTEANQFAIVNSALQETLEEARLCLDDTLTSDLETLFALELIAVHWERTGHVQFEQALQTSSVQDAWRKVLEFRQLDIDDPSEIADVGDMYDIQD